MQESTPISQIDDLCQRVSMLVRYAQQLAVEPNTNKPPVEFTVSEVAEILGRTPKTIKAAEAVIGEPGWQTTGSIERRVYTPGYIAKLRKHLLPKSYLSRPITITIGSYKGGSAKTTTTTNMAHCLALRGYRVLVIDTDPQATTTQTLLASVPDADIPEENTLAPLFYGQTALIDDNVIHSTNWENVDVIPAMAGLQAADDLARENRTPYSVLDDALDYIRDQYHFIFIDTPPTLSVLSMAAMRAADVMILPLPPRMPDISSAAKFISMTQHYWQKYNISVPLIGVLRTMVSRAQTKVIDPTLQTESPERALINLMNQAVGPYMISSEILSSTVVTRLAGHFRTLYETDSRDKSWKRAISGYEDACDDILERLRILDQQPGGK